MEENFKFEVDIYNDDVLMFQGVFYDWLLEHEGTDLEDFIYILENWIQLFNKGVKEQTIRDFNTGNWKIIKH